MLHPTVNVGLEYAVLDRKISFGLLSTTRFYMPPGLDRRNVVGQFPSLPLVQCDGDWFGDQLRARVGLAPELYTQRRDALFGSDYMVTRVTPQWIPTGRATAKLNLGMNIPIGRRHDLDFQPVYYR